MILSNFTKGCKTMNSKLENLKADFERINFMMHEKAVFVDDVTKKEYFTGYAYKTLYDWDQYFEAIVQIYLGWGTHLVKNGVTIFLDNEQEDGFIWRSVPRCQGGQGDEHVKPFLPGTALPIPEWTISMSVRDTGMTALTKEWI